MLADTWGIPDGETDHMLQDRERLHDALALLTEPQRTRLAVIDDKVQQFLARHRHDDDLIGDLPILIRVVDLIRSERSAESA